MQGILPDASAFLVSGLPSRQWFSEATIHFPGMVRGLGADVSGISQTKKAGGLPPKAKEALTFFLNQVGRQLPPEVWIDLYSNIPWGKGLSSSSTDILSVLSLVNNYLETGLPAGALYQIAAHVEPTDPCLSEDILVFYQHSGVPGMTIDLPSVTLLYFDTAPDHRVDTLQIRRPWQVGAGEFFAWLLRRFMLAASEGNYAVLFDAITSSAEYNQMTLPLPGFADLYRLAEETGTGLMVAHSGTIAGLLTRPEQAADVMSLLEKRTEGPVYMEHYFSPHHRSVCQVSPVH